MAKVSVGLLNVFNHEVFEWALYKGRLEQWFLANDITSDTDKAGVKRRAILLSSLAENTYKLIRDLALPKDVGDLSYEEVTTLLDGHLKIKTCGFAERHRFHNAVQEPNESLAQWAARVRGLAINCGFATSVLNDELRDRFVIGMFGGPERDRLFSEPLEGLTMQKALQIAESIHCAREGARSGTGTSRVGAEGASLDVHKVDARAGGGGPPPSPAPFRRQYSGAAAAASGGASRAGGPPVKCFVCSYFGHSGEVCRFKNYVCKKCGVKGHLRRACKKSGMSQHFLHCCTDDGEDDGKQLVFNIRCANGEPMQESILVGNVKLVFEIDTGSAVTAFSDKIYKKYFTNYTLQKSNNIFKSYNGEPIKILGVLRLPFRYKNQTEEIIVYVIEAGGPPLLGRDFIGKFNLQVCQINNCELVESNKIFQEYPNLFSDKLGCCKGIEIKLNLKPDSQPIYYKSRPVPLALKSKLEAEINRLVDADIIEPVTFSEYASPVVPVLKPDGSLRLCADYSVSLNKLLQVEKYPLPRIEELFARLYGGLQFTKLDLSSAYNQLTLHRDSQMLTCINTHKGLYKYKRLVFGLANAPAIFQRTLENLLSGIEGVLIFLDDILITGRNKEEHVQRLHEVFSRLEQAGLVLKKEKCSFFQETVSYLGYVIDKHGLHKSQEKIKAIVDAKRPGNVTELKSFIGLVNYYRSFVRNASSIMCPLHSLLKKNSKWTWTDEHEKAFLSIKKELSSDKTLAHFNPAAKLILTVDASPFGLGAILSQEEKGVEKPISFVSRSLSSAEKQYSQIQKEATAIIFGVRKFHHYLYGRAEPFVLKTDHKPLLSIFSPSKGVPEVTANRLQRYALFLSAYNYVIQYVDSAHNTADYLSRCMPSDKETGSVSGQSADTDRHVDVATYMNFVWRADSSPLRLDDVRRETELDAVLSQVKKFIENGWPLKVMDQVLKPYFDCKQELALENGCIIRGYKLVIPLSLREVVLKELHAGHIGIAKMKCEARSRFWWPGLAAQLERTSAACDVCARLRPAPARAPLTPWPYPDYPWQRVHLDFLGPFHNKTYLIAVDAYSKWVEVFDVSGGYSSRVVIDKLCELMSRFGLFNTICSDNGTSFVSQEFKHFCTSNGIAHLTSPTYHPASNGQAESYVKIVKKAIKSILLSGTNSKDINIKLNEFLFYYRNSVHSSTDRTPAQLLFGRNLRSRLDLMKPSSPSPPSDTAAALAITVAGKQCLQAKYYRGKRNIDFKKGQLVWIKRNYNLQSTWMKGIVHKKLGNSAYLIKLCGEEQIIKRHKNQIYEVVSETNVSEEVVPSTSNMTSELVEEECGLTEKSSLLDEGDVEFLPPVVWLEDQLEPSDANDVNQSIHEDNSVNPQPPIQADTSIDQPPIQADTSSCNAIDEGEASVVPPTMQAAVASGTTEHANEPGATLQSADNESAALRLLRPRFNLDYRKYF